MSISSVTVFDFCDARQRGIPDLNRIAPHRTAPFKSSKAQNPERTAPNRRCAVLEPVV
jgi:hypothetical protein